MKNQKQYEADDKMITLIRDNYDLLQALGSFGISLGFGDKTVRETCEDNDVDTYTFLAVVNFTINGYGDYENDEQLSVPTLMLYLDASHKLTYMVCGGFMQWIHGWLSLYRSSQEWVPSMPSI